MLSLDLRFLRFFCIYSYGQFVLFMFRTQWPLLKQRKFVASVSFSRCRALSINVTLFRCISIGHLLMLTTKFNPPSPRIRCFISVP